MIGFVTAKLFKHISRQHARNIVRYALIVFVSGNGKDVNSCSVGSDLRLTTKKPSRHVSVHIPSADEVACPTESVRKHKRQAGWLSHARSSNALVDGPSTASVWTKSPPAVVDKAKYVFGLSGESSRSPLKSSKLTASMPRLDREHRKSASVHDSNSSVGKLSSAAADSLSEDTVFSKVTEKATPIICSRSDIFKTLASEVKSGKMSRDLAKLVISLSRQESEMLPLMNSKVIELRRWVLAADSGCSKLPLSVRNHLHYVIQVSDTKGSTTEMGSDCTANETGKQTLGSHRKAAVKTTVKSPWRRISTTHKWPRKQQKRSDSNDHGRRPMLEQSSVLGINAKSSSSSFDKHPDTMVALHFRHILHNSTSKCRRVAEDKSTSLKQRKLHRPASSLIAKNDATTNSEKLIRRGQNFNEGSHLQKTAQQQAGKSSGPKFHSSAANWSVLVTSSDSSPRSQESVTRRQVPAKKVTSAWVSRKSSGRRSSGSADKTQNSVTVGSSRVFDSCSSSSSSLAHQSLDISSSNAQKNPTCGKVHKGASNIRARRDTSPNNRTASQNNKTTAAVIPVKANNKKVVAGSTEVSQSCKTSQLVCDTKPSSRWSLRQRSGSKVPTPKPVNDKRRTKQAQLLSKTVNTDSKDKTTVDIRTCQQACDKSSVETVKSGVPDEHSRDTDSDTTLPDSSVEEPSLHFKVHSVEDRSGSEDGRRTNKPSPRDVESSALKSRIPTSTMGSKIKAPQKRTPKITRQLAASSQDAKLVGVHNKCTCGPAKVASSDKAASTDSEPVLGTTASHAESCDEDRRKPKTHHDSQLARSDDVVGPSKLQHRHSSVSHNNKRHLDTGDVSNSDLEDIYLETCPSSIFSISSLDIDADLESDHEDDESMTEVERALDNGMMIFDENDVNQDVGEDDAENQKVLRQRCSNDRNDNVNNWASPTSNSSLIRSDVRGPNFGEQVSGCRVRSCGDRAVTRQSSSHSSVDVCLTAISSASADDAGFWALKGRRADRKRVLSSGSIGEKTHSQSSVMSDSSGSVSLSPSDSAAYDGGPQQVRSLPVISGDEDENLWQKGRPRRAKSDSLPMQRRRHDTSSESDIGADADVSNLTRKETVDLDCEKPASKFRTDLRKFVNNARCSPVKQVAFDADNRQMSSNTSESDTSYEVLLSNSVSSSDRKSLNHTAKEVTSDCQETTAKPADKELSNSEACHNVLSDSRSTIDYESLKAVVRNVAGNSTNDLKKPRVEKAEMSALNPATSESKHTNNSGSCQSLKDSTRNTNASSNQPRYKSASERKPPGGGYETSTSSSHFSEPETSAVSSLADDSTDQNLTSSSDAAAAEADCRRRVGCDDMLPESTSVTSSESDEPRSADANCDRNTATMDDPVPDCSADVCCRRDKRATCAEDRCCLAATQNAMSDDCAAGFCKLDGSVPRDIECRRLCCSIDDRPSKSQRRSPCRNVPYDGDFTRSDCHLDEEQNSGRSVSRSRYRKCSNICGAADAEKDAKNLSYDICACVTSHARSEDRRTSSGPCRYGKEFGVDPCDYTTAPGRSLPRDVAPHKHRAKLNCKSVYRVQPPRRRHSRRSRCPSSAKSESARETRSSDADVDDSCLAFTSSERRVNFDSTLDLSECRDSSKRISCSQLYRMSRAGRAVTQSCPPSSECDTSISSAADADSCANATAKFPRMDATCRAVCDYVLPDCDAGDAEDKNTTSLNDDTCEIRTECDEMLSCKTTCSSDQTNAPPPVQTDDETLPKEVAAELAAEDEKLGELSAPVPVFRITSSADKVAIPKTPDRVDSKIGPHPNASDNNAAVGTSLSKSDTRMKLAEDRETPALNSPAENPSNRPMTPSVNSTYRFTDNTASSPSVTLSLQPTESRTAEFVSSRLLVAAAKKQRQKPSSESVVSRLEDVPDVVDLPPTPSFAKKSPKTGASATPSAVSPVAVSPSTAHPEPVVPATWSCRSIGALQAGPFDCSDPCKPAAVGRTTPGVGGYLQHRAAAAGYSEWSGRPAVCAEGLPVKHGSAPLPTTDTSAATGYQVPAVYVTATAVNFTLSR